jgi:hypothetical protein
MFLKKVKNKYQNNYKNQVTKITNIKRLMMIQSYF